LALLIPRFVGRKKHIKRLGISIATIFGLQMFERRSGDDIEGYILLHLAPLIADEALSDAVK
jgi:hypothetical protein